MTVVFDFEFPGSAAHRVLGRHDFHRVVREDPIDRLEHAAGHAPGIKSAPLIKAEYLGRELRVNCPKEFQSLCMANCNSLAFPGFRQLVTMGPCAIWTAVSPSGDRRPARRSLRPVYS
jgi:hypothetical protein